MFASEYGWTVPDLLDLTMEEIMLIQKSIYGRYKRQEDAMKKATKGGKSGRGPDHTAPKKKLEHVLGKYQRMGVVETK